MAVGGVALEVALQGAFFLGNRQFVVGQGEVVHADVAIAGGGQLLDGGCSISSFAPGGQVVAVDPPLRHETLRQVRVVEHRQRSGCRRMTSSTVRAKFRGLLGQAVDQVDVDRAKLQGARRVDHGAGFFQALQAIDRTLHRRVEVLHADADAVEAQLAQQAHGRPVGLARVDLDAVVAGVIVQQIEVLAQVAISWRSSSWLRKVGVPPPKCSCSTLLGVEVAGDQLDFLLQALQVGWARPRSLVMTLLQAQ
jgi:hypothetical protein